MKRNDFYKMIDRLILLKRNIKMRNEKKYLKKNVSLKGTHLGERCFIFGNGPSNKLLDFSTFSDEFVFTVNQLARNNQFPKLKTNVHFWADYNFFNLDLSISENQELFNQMKNVKTADNSPECFFPLDFRKYIEDTKLNEAVNTNYFLPTYALEYFPNKENRFDDVIPAFYTVVHYAIFLANYMGFSEIYLLGCENSSIVTTIKVRMDEDASDTYGYDLSENEKKRMKTMRSGLSFSDELYAFYRATKDYESIKSYCEKHGTHIYNCTPSSLIDCIEHKDITEILGDRVLIKE